MAEVRKISEGVFLISWTSTTPSYCSVTCTAANVAIEEISQSYQLSFIMAAFDHCVLGIEIDPNPSTKYKENCQAGLKLESVLAIKDGNKQSMELLNSKWTAQFSAICGCGCGNRSATSKFDILLDFNSTSMKTESNRVLAHLLTLWETKTLADVTFKFQEKDVQAHTLIIASGSPVLAAMFQNDFKEKQEKVVTIKDATASVFEKMLRFFYTGNAILDDEDVADLLILANKYGVDSLKKECSLFIAENLTVDNVIQYLIMSHLHEAPKLHQSTLEFISKNSLAIVSKKEWVDLMKNHRELCLAAVQMMVLTLNKSNQ